MGDEHLSIISETESDEVIKTSVENLVPIPSESKSLSNEDVLMENFKIYSSPLFDDEESISPKIDPHYFNVESDLIESLLSRDTLIDSSPKFDYLLEEFSGKLAHIDPIPSRIKEADFDLEEEIHTLIDSSPKFDYLLEEFSGKLAHIDPIPSRIKEAYFDLEEEIRLVENFSYDNLSPRPLKELNVEIADTIVESLSLSPIPVEDSDSQMEEIDLILDTGDLMPSDIKYDDYDSERDTFS
uniref:Reverse transcriptase domain-containing protein n=1 Tax=Tanacetum cinerariifolium TaxID=118510 RepID=A0A699J1I6_TANCI|nr:hypothetical protein [Tanacetum cinerariifolium]